MDIDLDPRLQGLDSNAQRVIIDAARAFIREKQSAAPEAIAPMDAGREGDEQVDAPIDTLKLINTTTNETATIYDIEVSSGGTLDPVSVIITNDGSVQVRPAE